MPAQPEDKVSTTRLAKLANLDSRQLFERLIERKWLLRNAPDKSPAAKTSQSKSHYRLTPKGEFEGGEYHQSDKFGEYIVWPRSLLSHNLLTGLADADDKKLTSTALGKPYKIPARLVNLVLADLGWIEAALSGWQMTAIGSALGGEAKESEQGAGYVVWPQSCKEQPSLQQSLQQLTADIAADPACGPLSDLRSLDGRTFRSHGQRLIANWLYLHQLSFACQRMLNSSAAGDLPELTADF